MTAITKLPLFYFWPWIKHVGYICKQYITKNELAGLHSYIIEI